MAFWRRLLKFDWCDGLLAGSPCSASQRLAIDRPISIAISRKIGSISYPLQKVRLGFPRAFDVSLDSSLSIWAQ